MRREVQNASDCSRAAVQTREAERANLSPSRLGRQSIAVRPKRDLAQYRGKPKPAGFIALPSLFQGDVGRMNRRCDDRRAERFARDHLNRAAIGLLLAVSLRLTGCQQNYRLAREGLVASTGLDRAGRSCCLETALHRLPESATSRRRHHRTALRISRWYMGWASDSRV